MRSTLRYPHSVLLAGLGLGLCADLLFYGRWVGISAPLFVGLGLAVLFGLSLAEGRPPARANLWLGGAALFFAACLALRDAPLLVFLNLLAVFGLLALLTASYRGAALLRLPAWRAFGEALLAAIQVALRPALLGFQVAAGLPIGAAQVRRLAPLGRGLIIAAPVLLCFTGLLMAADSVFASYVLQLVQLQLPFDPHVAMLHGFLVGFVGWVCAGGVLVALRDEPIALPESEVAPLPAEGDTQRLAAQARPWQPLGAVEALTVLLSVNGLFGSFMLVQGAYFFGGLDTLDRTGMTFSAYARRGFFELLAVACLALAMLWLLALLTRRELPWQRRGFHLASAGMIVLVLGMIASAFQRMWLYEEAYGYSRLRLYTHSFMLWLAVVLLILLFALLRERMRLFTAAGFAAALVYLALLNMFNLDAMIVRENVARYQRGGVIDTAYLLQLSADATPDLAAALPLLPAAERAVAEQRLRGDLATLRRGDGYSGWPGWHLARARAQAALEGALE